MGRNARSKGRYNVKQEAVFNTEELSEEIVGVIDYLQKANIPPERGYAVLMLTAQELGRMLGVENTQMWEHEAEPH